MHPTFDLVITRCGEEWAARNDDISATGRTIDELDERIKNRLAELGHGKAVVNMFFDSLSLPVWMRQYASHYFNRSIYIEEEARSK